jgi:hypothetical protein
VTALRHTDGSPYFAETLFEFHPDRVETPAGDRTSSPASYTTFHSEYFSDITIDGEKSVSLLLPVETFLQWVEWFGDADSMTLTLYGADQRVADAYELEAGGYSVRIRTPNAPERLETVSTTVTESFEDAAFTPADASREIRRVETDCVTLGRIADAVHVGTRGDTYPVVLDGSSLVFDIDVEGGKVRSENWSSDRVEHLVRNQYGDGFAAVVRTLTGDVALDVVPGGPMAVIQDREYQTLRYVLRYVRE